MCKVSIIIPVYMVEEYIDTCLKSVVSQSLKDIEVIVVNDGTKDNSMAVVEKYIKTDKRIKIINKKNGGLMSAWIEGLKEAKGQYIGFVDSDDWVDPDFFEYLYIGIRKYDADIITGTYVCEGTDGKQELKRSHNRLYSGAEEISSLINSYLNGIFLDENIISYCRWDKLYRRDLLINNLKYLNTRISLGEDVNTNMAVLPDCRRVYVYHNSPKYHYRLNSNSIVNKFSDKHIDNIDELYLVLMRIAGEKGIKTNSIDVFIGNMIFEEINKVIFLNRSYKHKKDLICNILSEERRKKTFSEYMKKRGKMHKVFGFLLLDNMIFPCFLVKQLYQRTGELFRCLL